MFLLEMSTIRHFGKTEVKPNAFWLQLSGGRFYPDFVAMLTDGRILVVEYKGKHLEQDAGEKRLIGELWAEASSGHCLFEMPVDERLFGDRPKVGSTRK